jgi:hypothetical protein
MKSVVRLLVLFLIGAAGFAHGEAITFYAQLIRATDKENQEAGWKPLGPNLSKQLCPKFRWKNYWEVNRQPLTVQSGSKTRVRLSPEREIEMELRGAGESEIRLYTAGKLVQKSKQSLESRMSIMGGNRENDESWFVVIRRDQPAIK